MKCLDNELIQMFIDGQVNNETNEKIKEHISECNSCAKKIEEHKSFIDLLKNELGPLENDIDIVPEFKMPVQNKFFIGFKKKAYLKIISAACLIIIVFFIIKPEKTEENQVYIYYDLEDEFDANLPSSEQEYNYIKISTNNSKTPF